VLAAPAAPAKGQLTVPAPLVGKWTRVITNADRERYDGFGVTPGRWKLKIDSNANILFTGPHGELFAGLVKVRGNRIHFLVGPNGNVYTWARHGAKVTFKLVSDATGDRKTAVIGTWTRV
jgi:hypothetical protein